MSASNLDEFFEVRVAGIKQQMESEASERSVDGLTPTETFRAVGRRVRRMVRPAHDDCWLKQLRPGLEKSGFRFLRVAQLDEADREWIAEYYARRSGRC